MYNVRQVSAAALFAAAMVSFATVASAQDKPAKATAPSSAEKSLTWGPAPAAFPAGAKMAVERGDPTKSGEFVVRLSFPAGYKIPPHWHPTDEHVTVISGSFLVGMGETFDKATMKELPAGGYVLLPAQMRHYAMAGKKETIVQVHGMGPFQLTYVNPADDPSTRSTTTTK